MINQDNKVEHLDFVGQVIGIDDPVALVAPGAFNLTIGRVVELTDCSIKVKYRHRGVATPVLDYATDVSYKTEQSITYKTREGYFKPEQLIVLTPEQSMAQLLVSPLKSSSVVDNMSDNDDDYDAKFDNIYA